MSFPDFFGFFSSLLPLPLWKLLIDCTAAVVMWALMARFVITALFGDTPPLRVLQFVLRRTDRLMRVFTWLTPKVLTPAAHSLYAAFLLFLLRYYGLPFLTGYTVSGLSGLPAEARLAETVVFFMGFVSDALS